MAIYIWEGKILTEGNAIAVHEDCCCTGNVLWSKCSDDTDAADSHGTQDAQPQRDG